MKKYWLIVVLSMVAVGMGIVKISYQLPVNSDQLEEIIPTTVPTPTTTSIDEADYPLWRLLPYSEVGFVVDRYIEPLTLMVEIQGLDKLIVAEAIGKWMTENGVNPETHKIVISEK